jgi:hypothetical protein
MNMENTYKKQSRGIRKETSVGSDYAHCLESGGVVGGLSFLMGDRK